MEQRAFGKTGLSVSILGFGGAEIGHQGVAETEVSKLLNSALDAGLNFIDTAECYKDSEEKIGRTVAHRRSEYVLATKVGHEHGWSVPDPHNWTPESITRTVERSLVRLKTDRVDLVQLHSCGVEVLKKGEAIAALQAAKKAGKTRFIGYSGDSEAARVAVSMGVFDALQISLSIADQESLETVAAADRAGMGVIIKRGIANAAWKHTAKPENVYHVDYWERLKELKYEFATPGKAANSAAEIALRFTAFSPGVQTVIVGTTRPERWRENAVFVGKGALPKAESEAIRARWKAVARGDWVGQV